MGPKAFLAVAAVAALSAAGAHAAAWQDTHKALRVGFITTDGAAYDMRKLEPFRAYLQAAVGMPVELVPALNYAALIDAEATDRVQYAIHSATSYVTTAARCACVEPLAVPAAFDGAKGFYAIILARADSQIRAPGDAKGKTLAVTAEDSIAGRLVPIKYLARDGIDVNTQFASVVEAKDPATAIAALQAGMVDLAVGWSSMTGDAAIGYDFGVLNSLVRAGSLTMDGVRVVWRSPLIPFGPHAIRTDLPDDVKMKLASALTAMATTAPVALDAVDRSSFGGGGFKAVTDADYAVIADLIGVAPSAGPTSLSQPAPTPPLPPPAAGIGGARPPPALPPGSPAAGPPPSP
jgi:phosphonate transport system substrate-binding protein